jgi:HEAT repeat protein
LLRDRSLEIRTAAAAALVRVGGEDTLPQLFLLFKERDARPYQAVAKELASLSGEASADMLARFLRKEDRHIRLAGALALARRHDPAAAKVQATLATSPDAELRFLAGPTVDADKRAAIAAAPEGYAWTDACTALAQGSGKLAAIDWILAQFPKLDPPTRTDLMGLWLASSHAKE